MTLLEAIRDLDSLSNHAVIYAREPWTRESECLLLMFDPESAVVDDSEAKASGYEYFIEVFVIHEVFDGWGANLGRKPTSEEMCDRVIHYAIYDA